MYLLTEALKEPPVKNLLNRLTSAGFLQMAVFYIQTVLCPRYAILNISEVQQGCL